MSGFVSLFALVVAFPAASAAGLASGSRKEQLLKRFLTGVKVRDAVTTAAPVTTAAVTPKPGMTPEELLTFSVSVRDQVDDLAVKVQSMRQQTNSLEDIVAHVALNLTRVTRELADADGQAQMNAVGTARLAKLSHDIGAHLLILSNGTNVVGNSSAVLANLTHSLPTGLIKNVTALEKKMTDYGPGGKFNIEVATVKQSFADFRANATATVKKVVGANLRGLIDEQRNLLRNLTRVSDPNPSQPIHRCVPPCYS